MQIEVIGDDIYVNGERAARIGPDAPWRVKDNLTEFLREAVLEDEESEEEDVSNLISEAVERALTDVMIRARKQAPVGLLSMGELSFLVNEIKAEDHTSDVDGRDTVE